MLLNRIDKAELFSVETHYYPTRSKLIANLFFFFPRLSEKILPQNLRNYNIAIIQLKTLKHSSITRRMIWVLVTMKCELQVNVLAIFILNYILKLRAPLYRRVLPFTSILKEDDYVA